MEGACRACRDRLDYLGLPVVTLPRCETNVGIALERLLPVCQCQCRCRIDEAGLALGLALWCRLLGGSRLDWECRS